MTWVTFTSTGRHQLQFRLVIEGASDQWVSHPSMVAGADSSGVSRRFGLVPEFSFSEELILQELRLEGSSMTFRIEEERNNYATYAFARRAQEINVLTSDATSSATTLTVESSTPFTTNTWVHLGSESLKVTAKPTGTSLTVTRAQRSTTAQKHYVSFGGTDAGAGQKIFDEVPSFRNRRVLLYAHGESEVTTSASGTLIWRGILSSEPAKSTPTSWTLTADSIASLFKQDAAIAVPVDGIRGHFYPWTAPIVIWWGTDLTNAIQVAGFFAADEELEESINTQIASYLGGAGASNVFRVQVIDGYIRTIIAKINDTTDTISNRMFLFSLMDGVNSSGLIFDSNGIDVTKDYFSSITTTTYYEPLVRNGLPEMPEKCQAKAFLAGKNLSQTFFDNTFWRTLYKAELQRKNSVSSTYPSDRVYLSPPDSVGIVEAIEVDAIQSGHKEERVQLSVTGTNQSSGYVTLKTTPVRRYAVVTDANAIKAGRDYGTGTLATFRDSLISKSVDANTGETAFITSDDVASWTTVVNKQLAGHYFSSYRQYVFTRTHKLEDIITPELFLISCVPYIDSNGKINIRALRPPTATGGTDATLSNTDILAGNNYWPKWSRGEGGQVNDVRLYYGYNPFKDDWKNTVEGADMNSVAIFKRRYQQEFKLLSQDNNRVSYSNTLLGLWIERLCAPLFGYLANNFYIIELSVAWTKFSVRLGDVVSITSDKLPDVGSGTMGVSGLLGLVVGRSWEMPGTGTLRILSNGLQVRGYSPSALLTSGSVVSGSQWSFSTGANTYNTASSATDISFFAVGDKIEIVQIDSTSPTTQTGTIDSIGTNTVTVTFDGAVFGGGSYTANTYVMIFRENAAGYTVTSNMGLYCAIADSDRRLYDNTSARQFG